jgi:prepilin-type N-terminal cleavage/methylation domain-containing protein
MRDLLTKASCRRIRHPARGAPGFTLIENLVAMVVFLIGVMAVTYLLADGVNLSKTGEGQTTAYIAAQEIIGMLRVSGPGAMSYNGVTLTSQNPPSGGGASVFQTNLQTWWQTLLQLPGTAGSAINASTGKPRLQANIQVTPTGGGNGVCPCSAVITESWEQNTYVVSTEIGY